MSSNFPCNHTVTRFVRWAFEQRNEEITTILMKTGVPHTDRDAQGLAPVDLLKGGA